MKTLSLLAFCLLLAIPALAAPTLDLPGLPDGMAAPTSRATISSFHFNADNEDWQMAYFGRPTGSGYDLLYTNEPALWSPTLGDPAGSVFQTVSDNWDQRAYWLGYIGDRGFMGNLNGQILQCNVYSTGNWATISGLSGSAGGDDGNVYARWVISRESDGGGTFAMYISNRSISLDMNSFVGWEAFAVTINEADFSRWPNSPDPLPSFADVMADYNQIGLYIFSGTDDMSDVDGNGTSWALIDGVYRLQHFGAISTGGEATWAVDNPTMNESVVATEATSFDNLKALYR